MRRGYSGISKFRRTIRRMEPEIQKKITRALEDSAREVEADAIGFAILQDIKDSGDLIHSISWKLGRDKSSVAIGPSAEAATWQKRPWDNTSERAKKMSVKQKQAKWQFFKGYWAEFGTAGKGITAGGAGGKGARKSDTMPQRARPFMNPAWETNRPGISIRMRKAVKEALKRAVN